MGINKLDACKSAALMLSPRSQRVDDFLPFITLYSLRFNSLLSNFDKSFAHLYEPLAILVRSCSDAHGTMTVDKGVP